jgi:hypothetical protein
MSIQHQFKIKYATIILSVTILTVVLGVMLDGRVVPEAKKSLMTEESAEKDRSDTSNHANTAQADKEKTSAPDMKQTSAIQIEELDQKANATIEKAEGLITQSDRLISKAGLPKFTSSKIVSPDNKKIAQRLANARSRLDTLKK